MRSIVGAVPTACLIGINDLLARLEGALSQQRQFMADASHELRTPVSVSRTAIEVTLGRSGRHEDEYRESLGIVAEQVRRLNRIVEDMFTLARADGGPDEDEYQQRRRET